MQPCELTNIGRFHTFLFSTQRYFINFCGNQMLERRNKEIHFTCTHKEQNILKIAHKLVALKKFITVFSSKKSLTPTDKT